MASRGHAQRRTGDLGRHIKHCKSAGSGFFTVTFFDNRFLSEEWPARCGGTRRGSGLGVMVTFVAPKIQQLRNYSCRQRTQAAEVGSRGASFMTDTGTPWPAPGERGITDAETERLFTDRAADCYRDHSNHRGDRGS